MMRIISVSIDMLLWIKLQDFNNLVWPPWRWPWRLERLCLLPGMLYPLWNLVFPVWNPREPPVKHSTWLLMRKVILPHLSNFKVTLFFFKKKQYHCLTIQTIMYEKIAIQTIDIMNVPMNHLSHLQKWNLFSALEYNLFFIWLERRFCMKLTHEHITQVGMIIR